MAERRIVAGAKRLAPEAFRKSTRCKPDPLTIDDKAEKGRVDAERRNATGANFFVAEAARLSARRKTNPLTVEQKAEK